MCQPIERFDSWLLGLLADMLALMQAYEGVGSAVHRPV
jgi:peptide deformylase